MGGEEMKGGAIERIINYNDENLQLGQSKAVRTIFWILGRQYSQFIILILSLLIRCKLIN